MVHFAAAAGDYNLAAEEARANTSGSAQEKPELGDCGEAGCLQTDSELVLCRSVGSDACAKRAVLRVLSRPRVEIETLQWIRRRLLLWSALPDVCLVTATPFAPANRRP